MNINDLDPTKVKDIKLNVNDLDPNLVKDSKKLNIKDIDPTELKTDLWSQAKESGYLPFTGTEKAIDPVVKAKASQFLEEGGFKADSKKDQAMTAVLGLMDTLTFGNQAEIRAGIDSLFRNEDYEEAKAVYEAAYRLRQEAQPKSAIAGEIVGYIAPGAALKGGKALATGAAQAIGVGLDRAEEGDEVRSVVRSLGEEAIGLGMGKLIASGFKGSKKAATKVLGLESNQADEVLKVFKDQKVHYDNALTSVNQLSEKQAKEFQDVILSGQDVSKYNYGELDEALDEYRSLLARRESLLQKAGVPDSALKYWGAKMMDAQYVGNAIDRRYGTDTMQLMNNISRNFNESKWVAKSLKTKAQSLVDDLGYKNLDESKKIIEDIEAGKGDQRVINLFEEYRQSANMMYGSEVIEKRAKYIPHYTKRTPELVATVRSRLDDATNKKLRDIDIEDVKNIRKDKELYDSLKYVGGYGGKKEKMFTDERILRLAQTFGKSDRDLNKLLDLSAASVKERLVDEIPPLIREYDLGKLLGGWADSVSADALMRKDLRKIRGIAASLNQTDRVAADYLRHYASDIAGGSRGLAGKSKGALQEFQTNNLEQAMKAEKAGKNLTAGYYKAKAQLPQYAQFMQAQLYPYFLGLRPDAVIRNLTQPYMLTVPSLATNNPAYITKLIAKGLTNTVRGMATGSKRGLATKAVQELETKGWLPPDPTPGAFQALTKGVESGGALKKFSGKALESANNLAMLGYQQSDIANRVVTLGIGKTLAKDAIAGHKSALKHINQLPPSYKRAVNNALKLGDNEKATDLIIDHLMATTQFNYNRASMSEYGREFGSAFSMFSKWPTAIGADVWEGFDAAKFSRQAGQTKLPSGTAKFMKKYMAPYLSLVGAYHLLGQEDQGPRASTLIGKDISKAAPIQSLSPLTDPGRAFTPPALQGVLELSKGKIDTAFGLIPGAAYGKFAIEKLPAYLDNERGVKPTQFLKD